ncbi:YbjQ family protein [Orenia marismortui]|uniref:YbjQ family protein n=1 Tax=Orenia marismortui TaxID=46469 RepID=UPI00037C422A|nr:YbjQ family protein [Orenia marismortui]
MIKIIITTTDYIAGKETVSTLGLVKGNTIRARHIGSDIGAGLKKLVGGEVKGYTKMINEARDEAMARMRKEATSLDADAIINVRFATSQVMSGAAEVLVYGTAIKLK